MPGVRCPNPNGDSYMLNLKPIYRRFPRDWTALDLKPSIDLKTLLVGYRLDHGPRARHHAMAEEKEDVGSKAQRLFG
jgi:hypothetical protein